MVPATKVDLHANNCQPPYDNSGHNESWKSSGSFKDNKKTCMIVGSIQQTES